MRVLVAFAGGLGHYGPLAPVARALVAAGHEVRVACQASAAPAVAADGLDVVVDQRRDRRAGAADARCCRWTPRGRTGRCARATPGAPRAPAPPTCWRSGRQWRPDVVLCDEVDFGAMVAAERLGVPHATVLVMAAGTFVRETVVGEPLRELRATHGLPDEPPLAMLARHLVLCPFPPSFRDPAAPLPATAHLLRPGGGAARGDAPDGGERPARRPGPSCTSPSARCSTSSPATSSPGCWRACATCPRTSWSAWAPTSTPPGSARSPRTCGWSGSSTRTG